MALFPAVIMQDKRPPEHNPQAASNAALGALLIVREEASSSRPIWLLAPTQDPAGVGLSEAHRAWLAATGWKAEAGAVAVLPAADGSVAGAVLGLGAEPGPLVSGALPAALPAGAYHFATPPSDPGLAVLGWLLGAYAYAAYRPREREVARLVVPEGADAEEALRVARAVALGRDLINAPANALGPAELADAALRLAAAYGAQANLVVGDDLLTANLPLIHAVGRASERPPHLVEFIWGEVDAPKVTLIGKGICFDTGGLNVKPAASMALMKKDMAGAASALACAAMIMEARLPVRLRVLIPAADNSISGSSFRPGDVLRSRAGTTVEIGNTDAEGRLVLADAMTLAGEEAPELMVTFATLTGAARVALGPDLPALYATDDAIAEALLACGLRVGDPLWRMPLWQPYDALLKSKIADVNHIAEGGHAGSITAALFLKRFARQAAAYVHLDIYGWVPRTRPGQPEGGEVQGARAIYAMLAERWGRRP